MSGDTKKLIAFNYFGGKFSWIEHLYEYFPAALIHLVDVFGGSFAVTLNYEGNVIKTANEINSNITNFFEVQEVIWFNYPLELTQKESSKTNQVSIYDFIK